MLRLGFGIAVLALVLDQASKAWLLGLMAARPEGIALTPFFNLVMVWNRGISFGLFRSDDPTQAWLLIGLSTAVIVVLLLWLRRTRSALPAAGIGLVVGGAVGNIVDRLRFGAVADFFDAHAFGWHWPAFNVADSAIVAGVGLLLLDALFVRPGPR